MNLLDGIIIAITLILAIKGYFNGVIKEVAGLIGIVGGLFLASKFYHQTGIYINDNLLTIPNKSAVNLVGFIVVFVGFWIF
jgi:membrane protein required for colicin V production